MKNIVQILKNIFKSLNLESKYFFWKLGTMPNVRCSRKGMEYLKNKGVRYYNKKEHEKRLKSFLKTLEKAP